MNKNTTTSPVQTVNKLAQEQAQTKSAAPNQPPPTPPKKEPAPGSVAAKTLQIHNFLEARKKEIAKALPKTLEPDRLLRIVLNVVGQNKKLLECDLTTLYGSVLQCIEIGLEPGTGRGLAFFVPYRDSKRGITRCQFIMGYKGMVELFYRHPKAKLLTRGCVYKGDSFQYELGTAQYLKHIPGKNNKRDESTFVGAYIVATLINGAQYIGYMSKAEIDKIRAQSQAAKFKDSPWHTHYEEMAAKTVLRHEFKWMPSSVEMQKAVVFDEQSERGEVKNYFEGECEIVTDDTQSKADELADIL
jgi:recombination protein RecT